MTSEVLTLAHWFAINNAPVPPVLERALARGRVLDEERDELCAAIDAIPRPVPKRKGKK